MNTIILMGTEIGDNCVIGAGSIVKGKIPSNSVIAGNPAKIICSLEDYYSKRKNRVLLEACECVKACKNNTGNYPTVEQMGDGYAWLYTPHTKETIIKYPNFFNLVGDDSEMLKDFFLKSTPVFNSYNDFLEYAIQHTS